MSTRTRREGGEGEEGRREGGRGRERKGERERMGEGGRRRERGGIESKKVVVKIWNLKIENVQFLLLRH